jgi:putative SOS response-associated peptidase YedK
MTETCFDRRRYSLRTNQRDLLGHSGSTHDRLGNLPPMPGIFPDYMAPIIRNCADGTREMVMARWGMPSSQKALLEAATKRADKLRAKGSIETAAAVGRWRAESRGGGSAKG